MQIGWEGVENYSWVGRLFGLSDAHDMIQLDSIHTALGVNGPRSQRGGADIRVRRRSWKSWGRRLGVLVNSASVDIIWSWPRVIMVMYISANRGNCAISQVERILGIHGRFGLVKDVRERNLWA
jgi:hypothetical protein